MRRSLPPLRTSSHSAEFGVDVEGHPNLGLAYLQFHREPAVSGLHPGHQRARPTPIREFRFMRWHPGDVMTSSSAAPQPKFLRRKYELSNKLL